MTPEASNTLLLWIFGGLAVVGAYAVVVFPIMFIIRLVNKIPLPLPEKELDELLRDINGGRTEEENQKARQNAHERYGLR
jgi:hypothetical protein